MSPVTESHERNDLMSARHRSTHPRHTTRADRSRPGSGSARGRRPYRRLHLVDAENLVGHGRSTQAEMAEARRLLEQVFPTGPDDQTVVGVDKGNVLGAGLTWPGAQVVWGVGPDGADLALLGCSDPAWIAARYDEVVIASGDHAFSLLAADLRTLGVRVTVVSRFDRISADLYRAASDYRSLPVIDLTRFPSEVVAEVAVDR